MNFDAIIRPVLRPVLTGEGITRILAMQINQPPLPKARPVATVLRNTNSGTKSRVVRMVEKQTRQTVAFRQEFIGQAGEESLPIFNGNDALYVSAIFYLRRQKTHFEGRDRIRPIRSEMKDCRVTGGDIDNYAKFVLDALTGLLYSDDCKVQRLLCEKCWDDRVNGAGYTVVFGGYLEHAKNLVRPDTVQMIHAFPKANQENDNEEILMWQLRQIIRTITIVVLYYSWIGAFSFPSLRLFVGFF